MNRSVLKLEKASDGAFHAIFRNNHSRKLYLKITVSGEFVTIFDCFYVDRPMRNGRKTVPLKQTTKKCKFKDLTGILAKEVGKQFYGIEFIDSERKLSTDEYINSALQDKEKFKFLIFVEINGVMKTRFKNRVHRTVFLEVKQSDDMGIITDCHYCDRRYKRTDKLITPSELHTIYFNFDIEKLLEIVNNELNCDFTDVIITKDSFGFEETNIPICG